MQTGRHYPGGKHNNHKYAFMIPLLIAKNKFSKERLSLGLDIGTQAVKFVKLKFFKEGVELCGFALEPAPANSKPDINRMLQSQNIKGVNISVSGPAAIIRYVNFPKMNNDELKQALRFEAQKHIPFSMDEVNLDSYILKEDLPDNKMFVLLAAAKKESINQRMKIIQEAGLKVNVIDVDSVALINAFNFNYPQDNLTERKAVALLNIGALMSNLNILENNIPRLSRDIHIAGNSFTQKLMDIFAMDFKSAEELKLNPVRNTKDIEVQNKISNGVNPDKEKAEKITAAIDAVLANLANEIRISFDYYESQSSSSVTKIYLSGGGSEFFGLKDMLANLLGIEVEYWDPFRRVNIPDGLKPEAETIKALSGRLAVALGLALR